MEERPRRLRLRVSMLHSPFQACRHVAGVLAIGLCCPACGLEQRISYAKVSNNYAGLLMPRKHVRKAKRLRKA